MKDYQQCKIDPESKSDCPEILDPKKASKTTKKFKGFGTEKRWIFLRTNYKTFKNFQDSDDVFTC